MARTKKQPDLPDLTTDWAFRAKFHSEPHGKRIIFLGVSIRICSFNRPVGWLVFNQPDGVAQPGSPKSTGVSTVERGIPSSSQAAGDRKPSVARPTLTDCV
jgi:hypothetical protein